MPISAGFRSDAMQPELLAMIPTITPEMFAGSPFEDTYKAVAPHPDRFPELVAKLKQLDETPFAWPEDDIRGITAPTLIVTGDADASVVEHAVAMFRLLDGGRMGDMHGIGQARLAVLPGTAHFMPPGIGDARPRGVAARAHPGVPRRPGGRARADVLIDRGVARRSSSSARRRRNSRRSSSPARIGPTISSTGWVGWASSSRISAAMCPVSRWPRPSATARTRSGPAVADRRSRRRARRSAGRATARRACRPPVR